MHTHGPSVRTDHRAGRAAAVGVLAAVLVSCTGPASDVASEGPKGKNLPGEHVHGIAFNPADGEVFLATHDGLYQREGSGYVRVGASIDLMGFTAVGPDHFYSSGHPGRGNDMADPVGLIESVDAGRSWSSLSRAGQTDFHALTASAAGVVGFDGSAVMITADGRSWTTLSPPVAPFALAASPQGVVLLATSESGPARSIDGGVTWEVLNSAPLLQLAAFADDRTVVGVAPDGSMFLSTDAGTSWVATGALEQAPEAVAAQSGPDGQVEVVVAVSGALMRSLDGGRTFSS